MGSSFHSLPPLPRLQQQLKRCQAQVSKAEAWHGELPVPVLNRSWLQLEVINVAALLERFPADSSAHAPELMRFRTLLQQDVPADAAEQVIRCIRCSEGAGQPKRLAWYRWGAWDRRQRREGARHAWRRC